MNLRKLKWDCGGEHGTAAMWWVWETDAACIYAGSTPDGEPPEYEDTRLFEAPKALAEQLVAMHNAMIDSDKESAALKRERDCYDATREFWPLHLREAIAKGDVDACRAEALRAKEVGEGRLTENHDLRLINAAMVNGDVYQRLIDDRDYHRENSKAKDSELDALRTQLAEAERRGAEVAAQAEAMRVALKEVLRDEVGDGFAGGTPDQRARLRRARAALTTAPNDALAVHDARLLARVAMLREALTMLRDWGKTFYEEAGDVPAVEVIKATKALSETADVDARLHADACLQTWDSAAAELRTGNHVTSSDGFRSALRERDEKTRADEREKVARIVDAAAERPDAWDWRCLPGIIRGLSTTPGNGVPVCPLCGEPLLRGPVGGGHFDWLACTRHIGTPGNGAPAQESPQLRRTREAINAGYSHAEPHPNAPSKRKAPEKKPCAMCDGSGVITYAKPEDAGLRTNIPCPDCGGEP